MDIESRNGYKIANTFLILDNEQIKLIKLKHYYQKSPKAQNKFEYSFTLIVNVFF